MRSWRGRLVPLLAFAAALLIGGGMTWAVWMAESRRIQSEFEQTADLAIDRIVTRVEKHVVLLQTTRGLFAALEGRVDRASFERFLTTIGLVDELSGIQGVGFARMLPTADSSRAAAEIAGHYGLAATVRPETAQPWRGVVVMLEPANERNLAALGFDMFSEDMRRAAMERAMATGTPQMSGPVELAQEITEDKQTGFLIYLAYGSGGAAPVEGFVYAPFRGGDLVRAALAAGPPLPVSVEVRDTGAPDHAIYSDPPGSGAGMTQRVELVGRQWSITVRDRAPASPLRQHLGSLLVGITSLMFAGAVALAIASRQQEAEQAREIAASAAREADYRGLLLQEMKHRIKNHIARIQSIARQSARGATDVKAFTETFDARLQSMAAVQEILAGTAVPQTDIQTILARELQQGLDTAEVEHLLDGPSVRLDESQAHAFALVAHELVTNAMKYGGLSSQGQGLKVTWSTRPGSKGAPPVLHIDWVERFAGTEIEPQADGFGSRLIQASLRGQPSGAMTRSFGPEGMRIAITFPLAPRPGPGRERARA